MMRLLELHLCHWVLLNLPYQSQKYKPLLLGFLWQIRSGSRGSVNGESVLLPNTYLDSEVILRMHTNCEWCLALSRGSVKGSHL